MKDIKTKQKVLAIKTKDQNSNLRHFIKQQAIHTRNKERDKKEEVSNPQIKATNKVSNIAKETYRA